MLLIGIEASLYNAMFETVVDKRILISESLLGSRIPLVRGRNPQSVLYPYLWIDIIQR